MSDVYPFCNEHSYVSYSQRTDGQGKQIVHIYLALLEASQWLGPDHSVPRCCLTARLVRTFPTCAAIFSVCTAGARDKGNESRPHS